jgi:hypothetical protein
MFLDKKTWDNLKNPEKIQILTKSITERIRSSKFLYLFLAIRYMGKMITPSQITEYTSAKGIKDVSGSIKVVYQPPPSILARAQTYDNNYMMHIQAL